MARKQLKEKLSGYFRETEEDVRATVSSRMSSTKPEKPEPVECSMVPRELATPIVQKRETVSAQIDCVEVIDAEKTEGVEGSANTQVSSENPRLWHLLFCQVQCQRQQGYWCCLPVGRGNVFHILIFYYSKFLTIKIQDCLLKTSYM
ncbi:MAG: hypothetical protein F6J92_28180 [Symploca sp. SIO1A3]|nr:hypothetical protein [Symploca sp. SIO1A3]